MNSIHPFSLTQQRGIAKFSGHTRYGGVSIALILTPDFDIPIRQESYPPSFIRLASVVGILSVSLVIFVILLLFVVIRFLFVILVSFHFIFLVCRVTLVVIAPW